MRRREHKIKERELRRLKKNARISRGTSTDGSSVSATRRSSRCAKVEPKVEDENEWIFDCVCGEHGINYVSLSGKTATSLLLTFVLSRRMEPRS